MRCCARNRQALRKSSSRRIERDDDSKKSHLAPEHDPEKWIPVFGRRSCSTNKLERDDDSKKGHHALVSSRRRLLSLPWSPWHHVCLEAPRTEGRMRTSASLIAILTGCTAAVLAVTSW